jgi:FtsH-binding integral membrane protein
MRWEVFSALAAIGVVVLTVAAVMRWTRLVLWGLAALGAAYAVALASMQVTTAAVTAPLVAGGVFVAAEGVFLAAARGTEPKSDARRGIAWLVTAGLGAIAVSALVLVIATAPVERSLLVTIIGTVAAVGVVGLLTRRSQNDRSEG